MTIKIPTVKDKIFLQYLTIINGVLSKDKKLTKIEIEVLDKLLYIDYLYKDLPKDKRDKILFHQTTKEKIRISLLNLSRASLDNVLSKLRKKGMIESQSLKVRTPIKDGVIELSFKLELLDNE